MYYFVERSIAVVKPKQPMLDWVNQTFTDVSHQLTIDSIRIDCNSYMIPEVSHLEDGIKFINEKFADLFSLELATWSEDQDSWPEELTQEMFWDWFDVEIYPTIIDLALEDDTENTRSIQTTENTIH